jgi:hypothetical protein
MLAMRLQLQGNTGRGNSSNEVRAEAFFDTYKILYLLTI